MQQLTSRITTTAKVSSLLRTILLKKAPSSSSWPPSRCFSTFSSQQRLRDLHLFGANNHSPEDLASIWDDYHLGRGHIGLTMKAKLYRLLEQRSSDCRYFVVPLWRGSGYTTMFAQVQLPYMLFTDFAESKDLVLIRGDIVFTSKLTDEEAKWLNVSIKNHVILSSRMYYEL
ncbi:hypothetical protein GQ457_07G029430 [Hibiscus cannabinus]